MNRWGTEMEVEITTEERLETLELEFARAQRPNRWLLAVVVLGLGISALTWRMEKKWG